MNAAADLLISGGPILTMDPARARVEAVAVAGGRILAAGTWGDLEGLAGKGTRRLDLAGRTLIPGFNDAHVHVWKVGHLLTTLVDLRTARSLGEIADRLRAADRKAPGSGWLQGRGYNEAILTPDAGGPGEARRPLAADLDAAVPHRPVFLTRTCGHIGVANTAALALGGIGPDTVEPAGGAILRDEHGAATGELHETAMALVTGKIPEPSAAEFEAMIAAAAAHHLRLGITSVTEAGVPPSLLAVYRDLDARGALPYRVNAMAYRLALTGGGVLPLPEKHLSDRLRVDSIKFFVDGGLSGATAALRVPYRHCADHGLMRLSTDEIHALAREAHARGYRIGAHAIGDAAIESVLDVYERLLAERPGPAPRIEHFGLPDAAQIARAARLGVIAVPQTIFVYTLGVNFRKYIPDSLLPNTYPVRDMLGAGLVTALSSDAPVVADENPLLGLRAAALRRDTEGVAIAPAQAIPVAAALHAYTRSGAIASGDEPNRGSIVPGKWADFAVLSGNPLAVPPEDLMDISVSMTLLGGDVVFDRG